LEKGGANAVLRPRPRFLEGRAPGAGAGVLILSLGARLSRAAHGDVASTRKERALESRAPSRMIHENLLRRRQHHQWHGGSRVSRLGQPRVCSMNAGSVRRLTGYNLGISRDRSDQIHAPVAAGGRGPGCRRARGAGGVRLWRQ
jgi:hypothetical protein